MKKLWNRLFKKNSKSKTLTPPAELKKFVEGIERDSKGKWVIPDAPKNLAELSDKLKDIKEQVEGTKPVKKPVAKKPTSSTTKKATPAKKPVAKKPTTKKNPPKGK